MTGLIATAEWYEEWDWFDYPIHWPLNTISRSSQRRFRIRRSLENPLLESTTELKDDHNEITHPDIELWHSPENWTAEDQNRTSMYTPYVEFPRDPNNQALLEVQLVDEHCRYLYMHEGGISQWYIEVFHLFSRHKHLPKNVDMIHWPETERTLVPVSARIYKNLWSITNYWIPHCSQQNLQQHQDYTLTVRLESTNDITQVVEGCSMVEYRVCGSTKLLHVVDCVYGKPNGQPCFDEIIVHHNNRQGDIIFTMELLKASEVEVKMVSNDMHYHIWVVPVAPRKLYLIT